MWNESAWVDPYQRAMSTAQPLPSQRGRSWAIPRAVCPMERFTYAHLGSMHRTFPRPSVHCLGTSFREYDMDQIRQEQYSAALRRMQDTLSNLWASPSISSNCGNPAYNGSTITTVQSPAFACGLTKKENFMSIANNTVNLSEIMTTASDGEGVLEKSFLRSRRYHDRPGKNLSGCGRPASFLRRPSLQYPADAFRSATGDLHDRLVRGTQSIRCTAVTTGSAVIPSAVNWCWRKWTHHQYVHQTRQHCFDKESEIITLEDVAYNRLWIPSRTLTRFRKVVPPLRQPQADGYRARQNAGRHGGRQDTVTRRYVLSRGSIWRESMFLRTFWKR